MVDAVFFTGRIAARLLRECPICQNLVRTLYLANEGRFVVFLPAALVTLRSRIGTRRVLDMQSGEQLPRIC